MIPKELQKQMRYICTNCQYWFDEKRDICKGFDENEQVCNNTLFIGVVIDHILEKYFELQKGGK